MKVRSRPVPSRREAVSRAQLALLPGRGDTRYAAAGANSTGGLAKEAGEATRSALHARRKRKAATSGVCFSGNAGIGSSTPNFSFLGLPGSGG